MEGCSKIKPSAWALGSACVQVRIGTEAIWSLSKKPLWFVSYLSKTRLISSLTCLLVRSGRSMMSVLIGLGGLEGVVMPGGCAGK